MAYRDSHAKTFYRALQCFLIDFWGQRECATTTDPELLQQLQQLPAAPGQTYCLHLTGALGGRVCLVHVVLGTSLLNSTEVRFKRSCRWLSKPLTSCTCFSVIYVTVATAVRQ
jgi:hypothetical protein